MDAPQIYIIIAIIILAIIVALVFLVKKKKREPKLTILAILAFLFVFAGILFVEQGRLVTYSLMGIGVIIAVIDIILKLKKK